MRVTVMVVLALIGVAHADVTDDATRLFDEGRALAAAGDHAAACMRFAASYELVPALGTQLNLADCHERQGKLELALHEFDHVATEADRAGNTARASYARERADALRAKLVVPEDKPRVEPPQPPHEPAAQPASPRHELVPALSRDPPRGRVHVAWGLAGAAAVTAITGTGLLLRGRHDYDIAASGAHCVRATDLQCDAIGTAQIDHARRLANVSTGLAIGTGVLALSAAIVYVTAPRRHVVPVFGSTSVVGVGFVAHY